MESREVFFNCLRIDDGKIHFKNFQLEEKYWVGIEAIHNSIILFHKFRKPDMPGHKGIYVFDILTQKLIWQNDDLIFLLAKHDEVYAYQTTFEGRQYYALDSLTGKISKDFGSEIVEINNLRELSRQNDFANKFLFPNAFNQNEDDSTVTQIFNSLLADKKIIDRIHWLKLNSYLMFNYHEKNLKGTFDNYFKVFDITKNKIVLNETLNSKSNKLIPESFFIVKDLLFLLVEKTKLVVYKIIQ
jgi:hypothetical protein